MAEYPEHEKMKAVKVESQAIGGFIEWLGEQGLELAKFHKCGKGCNRDCRREENGTLESHRYNIQSILAQYFEIDLDKIEQEKRAMLATVREVHEEKL